MLAFDMALTALALVIAYGLRQVLPLRQETANLATLEPLSAFALLGLIMAIWSVVFNLGSVYDTRQTLRVSDELQNVFVAVLLSSLILAGTLYLSLREVSRILFLYFCVVDLILLVVWRLLVRLWLHTVKLNWPSAERRVLIIGAGKVGQRVEKMLLDHHHSGIHVIGFLDDDPAKLGKSGGGAVIGASSDVLQIVSEQRIDEVIIALPSQAHQRVFELVSATKHLPVWVHLVPDVFDIAFSIKIDQFSGIPMISLRESEIDGYQRIIKRIFDLTACAILLVLFAPLFCAIALAIRLDSPGPVFFKQQRVGENGRLFGMYKFRSMLNGAELRQAEIIQQTADGKLIYKHRDDPRVTRVGRFIRATSLDELPQLFNVLKSEMSLVGPRPEMPEMVEQYEFWQRRRFTVPQGLTGWWQVNGRSDKPMHLHTMEDLYYIQNYSLWLDIQILWKTIGVVLKRKGAF